MFLLNLWEIYFIKGPKETVFRLPSVMVGVIMLVTRKTDSKILLKFIVFKNHSMVQTEGKEFVGKAFCNLLQPFSSNNEFF